MLTNDTHDKLRAAAASLVAVRNTFFEVSRDVVESGADAGWRVAKELIALAETVDSVRANVLSLDETPRVQSDVQAEPRQREMAGPTPATPRKRKSEYPKFFVREDMLVKVGLGRDRRTEYEHTVSKSEFDAVVTRIAKLLVEHRSFNADQLQDGLASPAYRTYIVLALLRKAGVISARQRGKYATRDVATVVSDAERIWTETAVS